MRFDTVIIGGGILGCALTFELTRNCPDKKIALVDQGIFGQGCSARAGAIIGPFNKTEVHQARTDEAVHWYQSLSDLFDRKIIQERCFFVIEGEHQTESEGLTLRDPKKLDEVRGVPAFLQIPNDACLSGSLGGYQLYIEHLCKSLIDASSGITAFECTSVTSVERQGNDYVVRTTDGRSLKANSLICTVGAWESSINESPTVATKKIVGFFIDSIPTPDDEAVYLRDESAFLLPLHQQGKWFLSITSKEWGVVPNHNTLAISNEDFAIAVDIIRRYCPSLEDKILGGRVHIDGYNDARFPAYSVDTHGIYWLSGGSGSGYRYGPSAVSELIQTINAETE